MRGGAHMYGADCLRARMGTAYRTWAPSWPGWPRRSLSLHRRMPGVATGLRHARASLFDVGGDSPASVLDRRVKAHDLAVQPDQPCLRIPVLSCVRMLLQCPRDLYAASGVLELAQVRGGVVTAVGAARRDRPLASSGRGLPDGASYPERDGQAPEPPSSSPLSPRYSRPGLSRAGNR